MRQIVVLLLILSTLFCGCANTKSDISTGATTVTSSSSTQLQSAVTIDENGIIRVDDTVMKKIDGYHKDSAVRFAEKLEQLHALYPQSKAYCTIIPDKSFYVADLLGSDGLNYSTMYTDVADELDTVAMISIDSFLTLDSYYQTDLHWRQECLFPVVEQIGKSLGFSIDQQAFQQNDVGLFTGIFSEDADDIEESLILLEHSDFSKVVVDSYDHPDCTEVYNYDKITTENSYDVFLSGATPICRIENPDAETQQELLIFGDSFASSITPLLIPYYATITLVDLRFMHSSLLQDFVPDTQGDILFLYSAQVVNNSAMLK